MKRKADHEPAYVLHTYPYMETSLIVEAFSRRHGRVSLLARGARVNGPAEEDGGTYVNTPLMMAAIQGHMSIALQLLRAGADPTIRVHGGHTAAELAAKYRHAELAQLLRCAERHGRHGFEQHHCRGGMSEQPTSRMSAENQPSPRHR